MSLEVAIIDNLSLIGKSAHDIVNKWVVYHLCQDRGPRWPWFWPHEGLSRSHGQTWPEPQTQLTQYLADIVAGCPGARGQPLRLCRIGPQYQNKIFTGTDRSPNFLADCNLAGGMQDKIKLSPQPLAPLSFCGHNQRLLSLLGPCKISYST